MANTICAIRCHVFLFRTCNVKGHGEITDHNISVVVVQQVNDYWLLPLQLQKDSGSSIAEDRRASC